VNEHIFSFFFGSELFVAPSLRQVLLSVLIVFAKLRAGQIAPTKNDTTAIRAILGCLMVVMAVLYLGCKNSKIVVLYVFILVFCREGCIR